MNAKAPTPHTPATGGLDAGSADPPVAGYKGHAPHALTQFWWDLLPSKTPDRFLPRRSGLKEPAVELEWITREVADAPDAIQRETSGFSSVGTPS